MKNSRRSSRETVHPRSKDSARAYRGSSSRVHCAVSAYRESSSRVHYSARPYWGECSSPRSPTVGGEFRLRPVIPGIKCAVWGEKDHSARPVQLLSLSRTLSLSLSLYTSLSLHLSLSLFFWSGSHSNRSYPSFSFPVFVLSRNYTLIVVTRPRSGLQSMPPRSKKWNELDPRISLFITVERLRLKEDLQYYCRMFGGTQINVLSHTPPAFLSQVEDALWAKRAVSFSFPPSRRVSSVRTSLGRETRRARTSLRARVRCRTQVLVRRRRLRQDCDQDRRRLQPARLPCGDIENSDTRHVYTRTIFRSAVRWSGLVSLPTARRTSPS